MGRDNMSRDNMGRDRIQRLTTRKKPSEKGHGPCICGEDHYQRDCPYKNRDPREAKHTKKPQEKDNKKKLFNSLPHEQEQEEFSTSDKDSELDKDGEYH